MQLRKLTGNIRIKNSPETVDDLDNHDIPNEGIRDNEDPAENEYAVHEGVKYSCNHCHY